MSDAPTAAQVARALADSLEESGVAYAIGGAIALGFYAPPRATIDVDVNVFVDAGSGLTTVLDALAGAGFTPSDPRESAEASAASEGHFRGEALGLRVDVFVPTIPFYGGLETGRREVVLFDRPLWILGPEDLAILKLMFFRRKDVADVEAMLRDQGGVFDRDRVRRELIELVGADDERVSAFDEIAREVDSAS